MADKPKLTWVHRTDRHTCTTSSWSIAEPKSSAAILNRTMSPPEVKTDKAESSARYLNETASDASSGVGKKVFEGTSSKEMD